MEPRVDELIFSLSPLATQWNTPSMLMSHVTMCLHGSTSSLKAIKKGNHKGHSKTQQGSY